MDWKSGGGEGGGQFQPHKLQHKEGGDIKKNLKTLKPGNRRETNLFQKQQKFSALLHRETVYVLSTFDLILFSV